MKIINILVIIVLAISLYGNDSSAIKMSLSEENGWEEYKRRDGSLIRRKQLEGFDLYALEIIREVSIEPKRVFSVLLEVGKYKKVLGENKYLEAEKVIDKQDEIVGYQYARIPVIPNRHYLFSFDLAEYNQSLLGDNQKLSWTLIDAEGEYAGFIERKNRENHNPVYIRNGAGIWSIEKISEGRYLNSYRLYLDPAGWMPGWLVNSFNVKNLEELFNKVLKAASRS